MPAADKQSYVFSDEEKILSNRDIKIDSNEITRDLRKSDRDSNKETCFNDLLVSRESEISSDIHHLLRSADSQDSSDGSEETDNQPVINENRQRTLSDGYNDPAQIPMIVLKYSCVPAWGLSKQDDKEVEQYKEKRIEIKLLELLMGATLMILNLLLLIYQRENGMMVEYIINSLPTTLSDSVDDLELPTPNSLPLLCSCFVVPPPGTFQK